MSDEKTLSANERKRIASLKETIDTLKVIHEYEKLRCEIQEYKFRRLKAIELIASLKYNTDKEEEDGSGK